MLQKKLCLAMAVASVTLLTGCGGGGDEGDDVSIVVGGEVGSTNGGASLSGDCTTCLLYTSPSPRD